MIVHDPPPGGPARWRELLREVRAALRPGADELRRELVDTARTAAGALRGAAALLGTWTRRRWPGARTRIFAASAWLETAARRLWVRAEAASARIEIWASRLWVRAEAANGRVGAGARWLRAHLRPALARAAAAARGHRPSPRQLGAAAAALLLLGWVAWERCGLAGCPDATLLASYQPGGASVLLDRAGREFASLSPVEREGVPLDSLPAFVGEAFVAVEDKRFYEHRGVDWLRVLGALWADVRAGGLVQGSSTIPMQLSRNLFPDRIRAREKTLRRKLLEVRMAREIEAKFSKREILELYLNHIYFGGGAYGVQAASRYYFGKPASALELHEAALLAALPKAPAHHDPRLHPDAARARRDLVLALMLEQGLVLPADADAAIERGLGVTREPARDPDGPVFAPYFVRRVRRLLEERLGEDLYRERLRILTTLDRTAQEAAEEELSAQLRALERGAFGRFRGARFAGAGEPAPAGTDYSQAAAIVMDARSGEVLAWVGGRDYDDSRYDRALLARRQAGSSFKPFVYAAALEQGFAPSQPVLDAPYRFVADGGRAWEPRNYSGWFEGRMSLREALVRSQNVPAVRLAAAVGEERVADLARRVGLRGEVPGTPVLALGTTDVTPLEMTLAYASFASLGRRPEPLLVLRVEAPDGRVLWEPEPRHHAVLDPAVAYILTDMLRDVVDYGTGAGVRRVGFGGPAAGKTGTTDDATDVWFAGYTPELVGTVWFGFDQVRPIAARASGGAVAAPAWGRIMRRIHADRPMPAWPEPPPGVVARWIDPASGQPLERGCHPRWDAARRELFLAEHEPAAICPRGEYEYFLDRLSGWLGRTFGGSVDEGPRGSPDPHLGAPRLPSRGADDAPAETGAPSPRVSGGDHPRTDGERLRDDDDDDRRERLREDGKRRRERLREERKRAEERIREERKRAEERLREARKRENR